MIGVCFLLGGFPHGGGWLPRQDRPQVTQGGREMRQAYAAYRQTSIQTAGPDKLLLMLFDGLLTALERARVAIQANRPAEAHQQLVKAQDIVREGLAGCLDMQYEISRSLLSLYEYCHRRLVEANLRKDAAAVEEVARYMHGLRQAFAAAAEQVRQGQNASPAAGGV
ncbi:MAG: flagellar export chaperone FliS [Alicyclobacillus sp.]|nr:flagellar export chaperone FliS [Alicyclobacillus sp.]